MSTTTNIDDDNNDKESELVSLAQFLRQTIREGAPLYNQGHPDKCFFLYAKHTETALEQDILKASFGGPILQTALQQAKESVQPKTKDSYKVGAWILRRAFDKILQDQQQQQQAPLFFPTTNNNTTGEDASSINEQWQDDKVHNTTETEKAQSLYNLFTILISSLPDNTFEAAAAVQILTKLGLSATVEAAVQKLDMLLSAGLIIGPSPFVDGTLHTYTFATTTQQLQAALSRHADNEMFKEALELALEPTVLVAESDSYNDDTNNNNNDDTNNNNRRLTKILSKRRLSTTHSPEHHEATRLLTLWNQLEQHLDIKDRKYRLKTYDNCFVGSEAVDLVLQHDLGDSRAEAVHTLNRLLTIGLFHHVTREHNLEDKKLFYKVTAASDIKVALDAKIWNDETSVSHNNREDDDDFERRVQEIVLIQRYKSAGSIGWNITEILNSFFGCPDESGWDLVDLQNWRDNMKRWGFGRREDQDDDMVNKLSPLVANIDPDTWEADEEWQTPYGILAQIAIFDQVPRSAFRGTPEAFKWDHLAIQATKTAIERGYFESAFKSTLNQFLILLPLEHSESWEDQKLGVHLLLQLLSTVAIQDEGLSDYEIVKRLEFSKRLTTAFLEHAQVIAKFKRYPHRNRPQNRSTTLEERIWLASDLVPRWAKSQNKEDKKNVIQLPVIPLKRLTKR